MLRFASTPERRHGNINLSKYFLPEWGSKPQPAWVSFTATLCATAPRLASIPIDLYAFLLKIFSVRILKYLDAWLDSSDKKTPV